MTELAYKGKAYVMSLKNLKVTLLHAHTQAYMLENKDADLKVIKIDTFPNAFTAPIMGIIYFNGDTFYLFHAGTLVKSSDCAVIGGVLRLLYTRIRELIASYRKEWLAYD